MSEKSSGACQVRLPYALAEAYCACLLLAFLFLSSMRRIDFGNITLQLKGAEINPGPENLFD